MQPLNSVIFYSVFSGHVTTVPAEDILLFQPGHLPLTKLPRKDCKKCYGRMFAGRDTKNLTYNPCSCVQKKLDLSILKRIDEFHYRKHGPTT